MSDRRHLAKVGKLKKNRQDPRAGECTGFMSLADGWWKPTWRVNSVMKRDTRDSAPLLSTDPPLLLYGVRDRVTAGARGLVLIAAGSKQKGR